MIYYYLLFLSELVTKIELDLSSIIKSLLSALIINELILSFFDSCTTSKNHIILIIAVIQNLNRYFYYKYNNY